MQSKSEGLILYVKSIKDNDLYIKVLSANDVVLPGLVYGGNSSKKRFTYQLGYLIEFNQLRKNSNSLNSINGEIISPYVANIYNDRFKSFSLLAIISILNECIYEGAKTSGLFLSVKNLINFINLNKNWLSNFCVWLLYLLKLLGYDIDYNNQKKMKYFNLNSLNFQNIPNNNNSIIFPYDLLNENKKVTYQSINSFFLIFETVFKKNHLNYYKNEMPINYQNFKISVLKKLKNIKYE